MNELKNTVIPPAVQLLPETPSPYTKVGYSIFRIILILSFILEILGIAAGFASGGSEIGAYIIGFVMMMALVIFILLIISSFLKISIFEKIIFGINMVFVTYYGAVFSVGYFENYSWVLFIILLVSSVTFFVIGLFKNYHKYFLYSGIAIILAYPATTVLNYGLSFTTDIVHENKEDALQKQHTDRRLAKKEIVSSNFNKTTREYVIPQSGKKVTIPEGYFLIDEEQKDYFYSPGYAGIFFNGETELWVLYQGVYDYRQNPYSQCEWPLSIFDDYNSNNIWSVPSLSSWDSVMYPKNTTEMTDKSCLSVKEHYKEVDINGYRSVQNKLVDISVYSIAIQTQDKSNYIFAILNTNKNTLKPEAKDVLENIVSDFTRNALQESDKPTEKPIATATSTSNQQQVTGYVSLYEYDPNNSVDVRLDRYALRYNRVWLTRQSNHDNPETYLITKDTVIVANSLAVDATQITSETYPTATIDYYDDNLDHIATRVNFRN